MARMPCANEMRHRVELQAATETRDAIGGTVATWATVATLWAKVEQLSAREQWHREQLRASAGWRVTIRWRGDVSPTQRVMYQGRTLEITGVDDLDQARRFLALACDERVAKTTVAPTLPSNRVSWANVPLTWGSGYLVWN